MDDTQDKQDFHDALESLSGHFRDNSDSDYLDELISPQEPARKKIPEGPAGVGERIRFIREKQGLSQADVASRTGLAEDLIAQIESGSLAPALGVLIKLSKALHMKMGTLISPAEPRACTVVKAGAGRSVSRHAAAKGRDMGYTYEHLAFEKGDRSMEPFFITLSPHPEDETLSSHDGEEFIYVLEGVMEARVGQAVEFLKPGDSIYYSSATPHLVKAAGDGPARIVAVIYAPNNA